MSDKRKKAIGEPVSKDEILAALGHLVDWARNERINEFRERLIKGNNELDLGGIKGCPGMVGYLAYLEQSLRHPLGVGTGLVTPEIDAQILATAQAEITAEITKYRALLDSLEKDPEALEEYLHYLQLTLKIEQMFGPQNPDEQPTEELQAFVRQQNIKSAQTIAALKVELSKYSMILECMEKCKGM